MSTKILWSGVALGSLGLGLFFPVFIQAGAILVCFGAVLMWFDK